MKVFHTQAKSILNWPKNYIVKKKVVFSLLYHLPLFNKLAIKPLNLHSKAIISFYTSYLKSFHDILQSINIQ